MRQQKGKKDTVLVGLGSYAGTVVAGKSWGAAIEKMYVPTARPGSIEEILHEESNEDSFTSA